MEKGLGSGIFFALPTMATSNSMFERLVKVYRLLFEVAAEPSVVLTHSGRHLSQTFMNTIANSAQEQVQYNEGEETASAQCAAWLADNRKKALLADVGVGTLDQALLAILPSRFQSLRLFGLGQRILIIDEVHAYDPYMNILIQNLLRFHAALGGSAILLSATLPQYTRQALLDSYAKGLAIDTDEGLCNAYPLATYITRDRGIEEFPLESTRLGRRNIAVKVVSDQFQIERLVIEASRKGKCVCWIRNTVYDALAGYDALQGSLPAEHLILFHAQFAMGDRLDIERMVSHLFGKKSKAEDRRGKVLVATQVVEQSLDLDFDLVVSDLAPMDLLIQRAGRLHRHVRDEQGNPLPAGKCQDLREPPCFIVYSPEPSEQADGDWYKRAFPKAAYVYPSHGCLWLTARLLAEKGMIRMPEDARELVEAALSNKGDDIIPELLRKRDDEAAANWEADRSLAHINMLKLEEGYEATTSQWLEDMRTPTRLGEMVTTVRLARWDGSSITPWYPGCDIPWDMSQVSIRSAKVCYEAEFSDHALRKAVNELKSQLPDKGKWSIVVPLVECERGCWQGTALNKKKHRVTVEYSRTKGVTVKTNEGQDDAIQSD